MTTTLVPSRYVQKLRAADPADILELGAECLADLRVDAMDEDLLFRMTVLFAATVDSFHESLQPMVETVVSKLRDILNEEFVLSHAHPKWMHLLASFWNICKNKRNFTGIHPVLDRFLELKESAAMLSVADVKESAARLFRHGDLVEGSLELSVAYYQLSDQAWYRTVMGDAVMYAASRRGSTLKDELALISLMTHWEYPERDLPVPTMHAILGKRRVPRPMKFGLLFMLTKECLSSCVRRDLGPTYRDAVQHQFSAPVNEVLNALID